MMCHVSLIRPTCKDVIVGLGEYLDAELTPAKFAERRTSARASHAAPISQPTGRRKSSWCGPASPRRRDGANEPLVPWHAHVPRHSHLT
jgi:hypothetical protein